MDAQLKIPDILERVTFLRNYLSENGQDSFEKPFYDLDVTQITYNKTNYMIEAGKVKQQEKSGCDSPILGSVTFRYKKVPKYFSNPMGKIHGGAMMTWVDALTSIAIFGFDAKKRL